MNDSLSAMLDGEGSPSETDRLLSALDRDPVLRATLSRQVLIGDSLRGVRVRPGQIDLAERVRAELAGETGARPTSTGIRRPVPTPVLTRRSLRWVPLAAAAGVATVAILAFRPTPVTAPTAPVVSASLPAPASPAAGPAATAESDRQLRNYLMTYSQSRAQNGMSGSLGYARYAAHSTTEPAAAEPVATASPRTAGSD